MSNPNIAGAYTLHINSKEYPLKSEPSFFLGGKVEEEVEIMAERLATTSRKKNPYIEGSFANFAEVDMQEIQGLKDATVVLTDPNGSNYVFRGCRCIGDVVNDGQGSISFKLVGSGKAERLI